MVREAQEVELVDVTKKKKKPEHNTLTAKIQRTTMTKPTARDIAFKKEIMQPVFTKKIDEAEAREYLEIAEKQGWRDILRKIFTAEKPEKTIDTYAKAMISITTPVPVAKRSNKELSNLVEEIRNEMPNFDQEHKEGDMERIVIAVIVLKRMLDQKKDINNWWSKTEVA